MNLMEYDEPVMTEQDEMIESDDDCDHMETEKDIDLMDTNDESDNDSESVRDSDIEFMNKDESEEELSFYRRFENTVQPFIVLLFTVYRETILLSYYTKIFGHLVFKPRCRHNVHISEIADLVLNFSETFICEVCG